MIRKYYVDHYETLTGALLGRYVVSEAEDADAADRETRAKIYVRPMYEYLRVTWD